VIARIRERPVLAVVVAIVAALVTVPLKLALNILAGGDVGLLVPVSVVVIMAWIGGLAAGFAATLVAGAGEAFFFMPPLGTPEVESTRDWIRLILLLVAGIVASWLIWRRLEAEERAGALHAEAIAARDHADLLARRLGALQALGAQLAQADSTAEIVQVLLRHAQASLLADGAAAFILTADGRRLRVLAARGLRQDQVESLPDIDIDARLPATEVARTGESVFIEDPGDYAARYARSYDQLGLDLPGISAAAVPIEREGRRFGVLGLIWNGPHRIAEDRRTFIESLANVAAGALDRSRLIEQERNAHGRLQSAQHRMDLLSEAGRVFGLSLDYESTLRRVASLAIPTLGDVCIVDIVEGDRFRRLTAVATEALAGPAAALEEHPIQLGEVCRVAGVLVTGESTTYASDPATQGYDHHGDAYAAALRAIGARWVHVAPLRTLDRTVGALTFMRREDRGFDADEIAVASQVADRAVHAIENARLHRQVRRLAERESRRAAELEAVQAAVNEGFLLVDADGIVQSSNAAASRLLGGTVPTLSALLERLIASGPAAAQAPGEPARPPSPRALSAEPSEYRLRHRPSAWIELTAYPIGEETGASAPSTVIVCRDVTAFRQGQALREAFLGLLSHELRTPVTTIYGGAAVLTRPGGHLDLSTAGEVLGDIASEADRLYRLVEDLLVLARFDEGFEVGADPVLLQRVVPAVVEQERSRWPAIAFELDLASDLPAVSGDETSITQVLRNLLSNASKYSGAGSRVRVIVEPGNEAVAVRVLDQGPGIDSGEADHLFDAFYRSPNTATMASGAGIGLYVSRRLIDAMGGRIWAAPRRGRGSEFAFALPHYGAEDDPA
jgi:K+-sensing histidine kinase KdpD